MRALRWKSVAGPAAFALVAVALLVYDHLNERVTEVLFWLVLALILAVLARMIRTVRRQSGALERRGREPLDAVGGLGDRRELEEGIAAVIGGRRERSALVLFELEGLQGYADRAGFEEAEELVCRFADELGDTVAPLGGSVYRSDGGRLAVLVPVGEENLGELLLEATIALRGGHERLTLSRLHGEVMLPDEESDVERALRLAGQRLEAQKQRQQRSARRQAHAVLMAVLQARRPEVRDEVRQVAFHSISVARRLGLSREEIDDVTLAAELQGIGLLAVPDAILESESELDEAQRALIRSHTVEGERIVSAAPGLAAVAGLVRSSAERFDGGGYPDGLAAGEIPLGSRIVAVCAAHVAMTSTRPHRAARSANEALTELRRCAGTQFDPSVVEALAGELVEDAAAAAR